MLALVLSQAPPVQQNAQKGADQSNDSNARQKPITPQIAATPEAIPQPHQTEPADLHWYSDVKITDGLIALFTLGLVVVGFFQWRALNDTVVEAGKASARQSADMLASIAVASDVAKAASDSAAAAKTSADAYREAERAWVSFVKMDYRSFTGGTIVETGETGQSGTMFNLAWLNGGRTPAIECTLFTDRKILKPPYTTETPSFIVPIDPNAQKIVLVPDVPVSSLPIYLLRSDIDTLRDQQCRVFIYGRAEYRDVFSPNETRHFEVCLQVEYGGIESDTGQTLFNHRVVGPQNSAS